MSHITFNVDTIPKGKGRPRLTTYGGHAHAYTPKATVEFEKEIRAAYKQQYPDFIFNPEDYLEAEILIRMPILKSFTKKEKEQARSGLLLPAKKPDVDNIVKSCCDALNTVCYPDDKQIVKMSATKIYSDTPGLIIKINKIDTSSDELYSRILSVFTNTN